MGGLKFPGLRSVRPKLYHSDVRGRTLVFPAGSCKEGHVGASAMSVKSGRRARRKKPDCGRKFSNRVSAKTGSNTVLQTWPQEGGEGYKTRHRILGFWARGDERHHYLRVFVKYAAGSPGIHCPNSSWKAEPEKNCRLPPVLRGGKMKGKLHEKVPRREGADVWTRLQNAATKRPPERAAFSYPFLSEFQVFCLPFFYKRI